jgi:plastocyanin
MLFTSIAAFQTRAACRWAALTRSSTALALLLTVTSLPEACRAETAVPSRVVEVHIDNFAFSPAEVTVAPGTTVRWTNRDDIPHIVAEKERSFRSKAMDTDESFSRTFTSEGAVDYFCTLHPHMTGRIIVK